MSLFHESYVFATLYHFSQWSLRIKCLPPNLFVFPRPSTTLTHNLSDFIWASGIMVNLWCVKLTIKFFWTGWLLLKKMYIICAYSWSTCCTHCTHPWISTFGGNAQESHTWASGLGSPLYFFGNVLHVKIKLNSMVNRKGKGSLGFSTLFRVYMKQWKRTGFWTIKKSKILSSPHAAIPTSHYLWSWQKASLQRLLLLTEHCFLNK